MTPVAPLIPDVLAARYAGADLVAVWSAEHKVVLERRLWLAVLRAQRELGVEVPDGALEAYEGVVDVVDLESIRRREAVTRHDVKARIEEFSALAGHEHIYGLGCLASPTPAFRNTTAVGEAVHTGTICQGGTTCQAALIDRRLGDYFSIEVAGDGNLVLAYSDTRMGGPVALPGFTRQNDGPSFFGKPEPRAGTGAKPVVRPQGPSRPQPGPEVPVPPKPAPLPATGGNVAGIGIALLAAAGGLHVVRRRRLAQAV